MYRKGVSNVNLCLFWIFIILWWYNGPRGSLMAPSNPLMMLTNMMHSLYIAISHTIFKPFLGSIRIFLFLLLLSFRFASNFYIYFHSHPKYSISTWWVWPLKGGFLSIQICFTRWSGWFNTIVMYVHTVMVTNKKQ